MTEACTIVVPCYSEAGRLNVAEFADYLSPSSGKYILFVDDESTDQTSLVLENLRRQVPEQIGVLNMETNSRFASFGRFGSDTAGRAEIVERRSSARLIPNKSWADQAWHAS